MNRIVTFKIEEWLLHILDRYARGRRLTRSEVIREAIIEYLLSHGISEHEIEEKKTTYSIESYKKREVIEIAV